MKKTRVLIDAPTSVLSSTYGLSSPEQLVDNTTDGSLVAILPDNTSGLYIAKTRAASIPARRKGKK